MRIPACLKVSATIAAMVAMSTVSATAAITKISLNDIIVGSETTTLVTNGDFEDNSSGNGFQPTGWGRFGNMFYDTPGYTVPNNSSQVANFHIDGGGVGNYNQILNLLPNTEYVLSAYMWHLGDAGANQVGQVEIDLGDAAGEPNDGGGSIRIDQSNADANDGYFVSGTFNTADTGTSPQLRIFMVHGGVTTGWPNQPDGGLWDNVAVTTASSFVAPSLIPEPTSLTLLLGAGIMVLGLRRSRK